VIFGGIPFVETKNWTEDFFPFGVSGVFAGAATVFFAYVGFDSVANLSEEVSNPNRNIPLGIIGSLVICTIFYMGVSMVVTGMVNYSVIDLDAPLSAAFASHGVKWAEVCIAFGALTGLTTTILTLLAAIPRVLMSMGADGLLPAWFGKIHPQYQTPVNSTIVMGVFASVLAVFINIDILSEIVSLGILFAFTIACACVLLLRMDPTKNQNPDATYRRVYESEREELDLLLENSSRNVQNRTRILIVSYSLGVLVVSILRTQDVPWQAVVAALVIPLTPFVLMHWDPKRGLVAYPTPRSEITNQPVFACPMVPTIPLLGIGINIYMASNLGANAYYLYFGWLFIGLIVYLVYGVNHSRLNADENTPFLRH
jgi:amino acid transporter